MVQMTWDHWKNFPMSARLKTISLVLQEFQAWNCLCGRNWRCSLPENQYVVTVCKFGSSLANFISVCYQKL